MESLTIRLPVELRDRVNKIAEANGMKPTAFVRFAVAQVLNSTPPEPGQATATKARAHHKEAA